jgi:antitoxin PrlF
MIAVLTSKGQLTLPKHIRDQLGLTTGSRLDFVIEPDGSLRARPLKRGAQGLFGLLHEPGRPVSSVREMNEAIAQHVADDDLRISRRRPSKR